MNDTNPLEIFRLLIDKLIKLGANLEFYEQYEYDTLCQSTIH